MVQRALTAIVIVACLGWPAGTPGSQAASSSLVISSIFFDPYLPDEPEEAVEITNIGASAVDLRGWALSDNEGTVTFPSMTVAPGQRVWATRTATRFAEEFGFKPQFEYGSDSDPEVPDLRGTAPAFANAGDEVVLLNPNGQVIDTVVYREGDLGQLGWSGLAVEPYNNGQFGLEGQILYRKLAQETGLPIPDTDTANDWAQATDDDINGKRVQYPGWSLYPFFQTKKATETGELRVMVAPDHVFEEVRAAIDGATQSIDIESYTLENADLVEAIVARQRIGVRVRILLEGEPVSGISDQERWAAQQIEDTGGFVYFMHTDAAKGIHDRYNFQHAKFIIIDGATVLVGSENLGYGGMPSDAKNDGTSGNRGTYLLLTVAPIVDQFKAIFADDLDPGNHKDLFRWTASHPNYGAPPAGFEPNRTSGGTRYRVLKNAPLQLSGAVPIEVIQCPENCLRDSDALLGLVKRAGLGDTLLVEQLYERTYWGRSDSNPTADPNPRLEAYIAAARRGTRVGILLDSFYDDPADPRSNATTAGYVNGIAVAEGLDLAVRLGNPTGRGIHNKMVLASIAGTRLVHVGSINGSENSHKNNREVAVQIESMEAYFYLEEVFIRDWEVAAEPPDDHSPPAAPSGLTARVSSTRSSTIDLDWSDNTDSDLSHYKVYVAGTPGGSYDFVATASTSAYMHTGLTQNVTYYYVVTAVDRAGNESGRSNEASVLLVPPPPPDPRPTPGGSGVVINEFRTRGPNGANDEFIELRNDSIASIDISGWQILGSNAMGSTAVRRNIPTGVILGPGCHYLLTNSNTNGYSGALVGDTTYGTGITDDGGIAVQMADSTRVDAAGMSNGSAYGEGTRLADFGSANSDRSYVRTGFDTNDNSRDFRMISPSTPRNLSSSCAER